VAHRGLGAGQAFVFTLAVLASAGGIALVAAYMPALGVALALLLLATAILGRGALRSVAHHVSARTKYQRRRARLAGPRPGAWLG